MNANDTVETANETITVRALRTGYYYNMRMRGDDTLGEGQGDVFMLEARDITVYDVRAGRPMKDRATGKVETRHLTAEEQFSALWMERVEDDATQKFTTAQEALKLKNDEIKQSKRRRA